jgi:peptidoglycan/xylan/chitin deacetylase (PgdA/CDA1 family)
MRNGDLINMILGILFFFANPFTSLAQSYQSDSVQKSSRFRWPEGKKMAISLTFDDARLSQPDYGIPLLDKLGVKATFYISEDNLLRRTDSWKNAVSNGHEIGNHSVLHPCSGNFVWSRNKALENYTPEAMKRELDSANRFIYTVLGIKPVSFAYPCGQTFVGRGKMTRSYVPVIAEMFETGRGWLGESPNDPSFCDLSQLMGMELDGKSFEQIKALIESAGRNGQWLILAGHEMNNSGSQTSLLSTIDAICRYAINPADSIWIDNVHNIAAYVKEERKRLNLLPDE